MTTSISEFERTKPVITMKKINDLIKFVESQIEDEETPGDMVSILLMIRNDIKDIKKSFKAGE